MSSGFVVLRDLRDGDGSRSLTATLEANGDLRVDGVDAGPGVERIFGFNEYEWIWTIKATDVPKLREALSAGPDVIEALGARFSGDAAAGLCAFLEANDIPYEAWSRTGD